MVLIFGTLWVIQADYGIMVLVFGAVYDGITQEQYGNRHCIDKLFGLVLLRVLNNFDLLTTIMATITAPIDWNGNVPYYSDARDLSLYDQTEFLSHNKTYTGVDQILAKVDYAWSIDAYGHILVYA